MFVFNICLYSLIPSFAFLRSLSVPPHHIYPLSPYFPHHRLIPHPLSSPQYHHSFYSSFSFIAVFIVIVVFSPAVRLPHYLRPNTPQSLPALPPSCLPACPPACLPACRSSSPRNLKLTHQSTRRHCSVRRVTASLAGPELHHSPGASLISLSQ
ncbi:hypothetical protein E2C01_066339 [Portunus trituberculatus]|uniref:Uncharacterized protein n=1 Tax=Portunus trituberculatus TaxID=210409 RepID=A0A5B7HQ08_PORTR|nr:hypothetical protein [Portunus trituberculatus]